MSNSIDQDTVFPSWVIDDMLSTGYCVLSKELVQSSAGIPVNYIDFLEVMFLGCLGSNADNEKWGMYLDDPEYSDGKNDDGIVIKGKDKGEDIKTYFHYRPRLQPHLVERGLINSGFEVSFLAMNAFMYQRYEQLLLTLARTLDDHTDFGISFEDQMLCARETPLPTSSSVLRLLAYPAQDSGDIAEAHQDRSFLTMVTADKGGKLVVKVEGEWVPVDMNEGEAVVFFGKKAEYQTCNAVEALWHKGEADPAEDRFSIAFFAHSNYILVTTK